MNKTQTVEERDWKKDMIWVELNEVHLGYYKQEGLDKVKDFIQQQLKANDEKWKEKIGWFLKEMEFNPETDNLEIDVIKADKFFTNLKENK